MALKLFKPLWTSKYKIAFLATSMTFLTVTATQAGFEWTPATPQDPVAPAPVVVGHPPASESLLSPLPAMPGEEEVAAPVQPVQEMPQENVIKRKVMTPAPMAADPVRPAPEPMITTSPLMPSDQEVLYTGAPEVGTPSPAPAMQDADADVIVKRRVVMPEDAPASVPQNVAAESERLTINPTPPPSSNDVLMLNDTGEEVVGFGNDIPLALALQQIAPAGYAFSFGENINPGVKVSWTGGKSWTAVMHDMIAPLDMEARITGKAIMIRNKRVSALPPMPEAPEMDNASDDVTDVSDVLRFEPAAGAEEGAEVSSVTEVVETEEIIVSPRRAAIQDPGAAQIAAADAETIVLASNEAMPAQEEEMQTDLTAPPKMEAEEEPVTIRVSRNDAPKVQRQIWEAQRGDSLKQTLDHWSQKSDIEVEWNASHDYMLESNVMVAGKIEKAIRSLVMNGIDPENGPTLTYASSQTGNKAKLIIDDQG